MVLYFPSPEKGKWHLGMIIDPLRKSQHPRLEAPHQPDTHTAWNSRPHKMPFTQQRCFDYLHSTRSITRQPRAHASAAGSVGFAFWSSFVFLRRTDLIPNHRTHEWILQVTQSSGHTLASPTGEVAPECRLPKLVAAVAYLGRICGGVFTLCSAHQAAEVSTTSIGGVHLL
jgi:hypothetical protein